MNRFLSLFCLIALAAVGATGCGDDKNSKPGGGGGDDGGDATVEDAGSDADDGPVNASKQALIAKDTGGEIELEGATLTIDADAMQTDEESVNITMKATTPTGDLPDFASVGTLYFEFEPAGLEFNPPAQLKIPVPADLGDNVAVISYFNEETEQWENLPTTNDGTFLTAPIAHFSGYAGRAVEASACAFEACGGSVIGFWELDSMCESADVNTSNPFAQQCPAASFTETSELNDGYISFFQDGDSSGYSLNLFGTRSAAGSFPSSCLAAFDLGSCAAAQGSIASILELETVTCTASGNDCNCTGSGSADGFGAQGAFTTEGESVTLQLGGENGSMTFGVCNHTDGTKLELGHGERVLKFTKNNNPV